MGLSVEQRNDSVYSVLEEQEDNNSNSVQAKVRQWRKEFTMGGMVIVNSFQVRAEDKS